MLKDLVLQNRSYRLFDGSTSVSTNTLFELIGLARLTASTGNVQPLKYYLSCSEQTNAIICPLLHWVKTPGAPYREPGNTEPAAYICMFVDTNLVPAMHSAYIDAGIAAQTILLGAAERGLGGCIVTNFDKIRLKRELMVTIGAYEPLLVIALGRPDEDIILEESGYDTASYADESGTRHVPKRQLMDIIIGM